MVDKIEKFNFNTLASDSKKSSGAAENSFMPGFNNVVKNKDLLSERASTNAKQDNNPEPVSEEDKKKYTENDLSNSKTKGYEEGYAKGYADAKSASDDLNKQIDENLKIIDEKVTQIIQMNQMADLKQSKDLAEIAIQIAKKVAYNALQTNPVEEVEKVIQKSFELFFDEPRLSIYINSKLVAEISKKVDALSQKENFRGEVEIYGREDIDMGSCSVEWQGGGLRSNKDDILKEIEKMCLEIN